MSEEQPTTVPQAPPAPPTYQPWASRFGMVRPRHGRYLAGVCAAIGRATNTDPLLWRVLIGVLAIFGVGIVIYLAGWLLIPAEGDTASPIEALFGRGTSSTSSVLTLVLGVIAVVLLGAITDSWVVALIAAVALVIAAMAINPRAVQQHRQEHGPPPPLVSEPTAPPVASYQPPFAPHGPYQPAGPPPVPGKAVEPKAKREPSRLGRFTFGLVLIVLGALGVADMAGVNVPGAAYVAAALAMVGIGLIVGAWFGRARGFIFLGLVLSLILPAAASGPDPDGFSEHGRGQVLWNPETVDGVSERYEHRFGEAVLDLSRVDFTGQDKTVVADISFGEMRIILPPNVDTVVKSNLSLGEADVFNQAFDGVGENRTIEDLGADGAGGGKLLLELNVRFGRAEVKR